MKTNSDGIKKLWSKIPATILHRDVKTPCYLTSCWTTAKGIEERCHLLVLKNQELKWEVLR